MSASTTDGASTNRHLMKIHNLCCSEEISVLINALANAKRHLWVRTYIVAIASGLSVHSIIIIVCVLQKC